MTPEVTAADLTDEEIRNSVVSPDAIDTALGLQGRYPCAPTPVQVRCAREHCARAINARRRG